MASAGTGWPAGCALPMAGRNGNVGGGILKRPVVHAIIASSQPAEFGLARWMKAQLSSRAFAPHDSANRPSGGRSGIP
ncbi:hypothetical protein DD901_13430, partial [Staphylococcus pseudintermedius]